MPRLGVSPLQIIVDVVMITPRAGKIGPGASAEHLRRDVLPSRGAGGAVMRHFEVYSATPPKNRYGARTRDRSLMPATPSGGGKLRRESVMSFVYGTAG